MVAIHWILRCLMITRCAIENGRNGECKRKGLQTCNNFIVGNLACAHPPSVHVFKVLQSRGERNVTKENSTSRFIYFCAISINEKSWNCIFSGGELGGMSKWENFWRFLKDFYKKKKLWKVKKNYGRIIKLCKTIWHHLQSSPCGQEKIQFCSFFPLFAPFVGK